MALPENIFLIQYKCNLHNTSCTRLHYTLPLPYNTLLYRYIRILCQNITELYHTSPLPNKQSLYLTQLYHTITEQTTALLNSTLLYQNGTILNVTPPSRYCTMQYPALPLLCHNKTLLYYTSP